MNPVLRVNEVLREKGIGVYDLCKMLGKTYQTVYAILNNNPRLDSLVKIAKALEVPVASLFADYKQEYLVIENAKQNIKYEETAGGVQLRIREIMIQKGVGASDIARHLKTSHQYVSQVINGQLSVSIERLKEIADFLGVTLSELFPRNQDILCPKCGQTVHIY